MYTQQMDMNEFLLEENSKIKDFISDTNSSTLTTSLPSYGDFYQTIEEILIEDGYTSDVDLITNQQTNIQSLFVKGDTAITVMRQSGKPIEISKNNLLYTY